MSKTKGCPITIPLFEVPPPARLRAVRTKPLGNGRPKWSRFRPIRRVPCDDCMAVLIKSNGRGPLSRAARWKRKVDNSDRLLCTEHANQWREKDEMQRLDDNAEATTTKRRRQ